MSYTGKKPTRFITHDMLKFIEKNENKKEQVSFDPVKAKSIESALREWRRERCLKEGIPAFMVMSDKTLIEISQNLPSTPRDLENINGIGPAKILMYGEDILKLINP